MRLWFKAAIAAALIKLGRRVVTGSHDDDALTPFERYVVEMTVDSSAANA